ncbi:S-adenosyl-L-methionine-dependent methyltransferase [Ramicandelaber brevisporus]|nr:S-adenosyl-L-methionine-dependent methyltransferase [Ramicandelaber brevisporus]
MSSTVPKGDFINETHQRDLEHSKVLHGNGSKLSNASFLSKLVAKNSAAHRKELSNYLSFWDSNAAKSGIEEAGLADTRQKKYTEVVNCYYNLITDSCELAWGQSIHFARKFKGEGYKQSVARHEHYLAALGQFKPGMKILDVGSGVGGPAREIARFIGCHITGINNNDYQIARATAYSKQTGTTPQTAFVKGDFMQMPFSDDSFDVGHPITIIILRMLELVRLAPSGLSKVVKLLNQTGAATNEAGAAEVFTPMYTILARKPQCT